MRTLPDNTLPRTHLIRLDSRSYLHAGANWVYPPRRCFSFFVTAADTTCLGLLVSYIQHVPTACLLRRFFYRFFLLLLLLLTTPDCVTHLILTNSVLSLSVPSLSLALPPILPYYTLALHSTTTPPVSTARDVVIRANGYD